MAEHPTIAAALIAAQQAFAPITKDNTIKQSGVSRQGKEYNLTYKYADLGSVLAAVTPALHDNGLVISQCMDVRDGQPVIRTILLHAHSPQTLESNTPIIWADKTDPQKFGGGITYSRRYAIMAMLNLNAEDDDANHARIPWTPKETVNQTTGEITDLSRRRVDKPEPQPERDIQPPPPSQMNGPAKSAEVQAKQDAMKRIHALRAKLGTDDAELKEHMRETYRPTMKKEEFTRNMLSVDELIEYGDKLAAAARKRGLN